MQTAKLTNISDNLTAEQTLRIKLIQDTIAEHNVTAEEQEQLDEFIQWLIQRNFIANS